MSAHTRRVLGVLLIASAAALGQTDWESDLQSRDPLERLRGVRTLSESGDAHRHVDRLASLIADDSDQVRRAVITSLIKVGGPESRSALIQATRDPLPDLQALAIDGLVDEYLPGYARTGRLAAVKSLTSSLKSRITDPTPTVVPLYVKADSEVLAAIGSVISDGRNAQARAAAARALGILRAEQEREALLRGVRSRDPEVVVESALAFKKIGDASVGRDLIFLLRDPERSVQEAACEALGQLRTLEAIPGLVGLLHDARRASTRAKALEALAKIPDQGGRDRFLEHLEHKDRFMRRAAAEGLGRLADPADRSRIEQRLSKEKADSARLALAFAAVRTGSIAGYGHLLRALNSLTHRVEARAFLEELAREASTRQVLYTTLAGGTDDQRKHLCYVLGISGGEDSLHHLEERSADANREVAQAALEALRTLRARLM